MMNIQWQLLHFDQLTNYQLYALLRLRTEVFVVEQHCVFQDMDNLDQHCYHLLGFIDDQLAAATRLVPADLSYKNYASIGRVVTAASARRNKLGTTLMELSISHARGLFGNVPIKIGAQLYLKAFYETLGFKQVGPVYDEDGIDHIPMLLD